MDTISHVFSMMNVYWKYSRKWLLGIVAGLAVVETGILLYYLSGGFRSMYLSDSQWNSWPMEYEGAIQSIRLEIFVLIFAIVCVVLLTLSFLSVNTKKTMLLVQRLPINRNEQKISQVIHSSTFFLILWLAQFLLLILGFLIYRAFARSELSLDVQLFVIFQHHGFVRSMFPFFHVASWPLCFLVFVNLALLPSFFVDQFQTRQASVAPLIVTFLVPLVIALIFEFFFGKMVAEIGQIIFFFLFAFGMILRLFAQKYESAYGSVAE